MQTPRVLLAAILAIACVSAPAAGACPRRLGSTIHSSWYGGWFHGRRTASGVKFDQNALVAAHRTLPFGTKLKLRLDERRVTVEIVDRGPAKWTGRDLDVSRQVARELGFTRRGIAHVEILSCKTP